MKEYPLRKRVIRGVVVYRFGVLGRGVCMKQEKCLQNRSGVKRVMILTPFDSPLFNSGNGIVSLLSKSYAIMLLLSVFMDGFYSAGWWSNQSLDVSTIAFRVLMFFSIMVVVAMVGYVITSQLLNNTDPKLAFEEGGNYPFVQFRGLGYVLLMEMMIIYMSAHGGWGDLISNALTGDHRNAAVWFFGGLWLMGLMLLQFTLLVMLLNVLLLEVVEVSLHKYSLKLVGLKGLATGVLLEIPCEKMKPFKMTAFIPQRYIPVVLIGLFALSAVTQLCLNESQMSGTFVESMIFSGLLLLLLGESCVVGSRASILTQIAYEQNRLTARNVSRHIKRRVKRKSNLLKRMSGPGPVVI